MLLIFDFVDIEVGCVVYGCIYYVGYFGGCNYEELLVNVFEVESCC